ncbi:DUF1616 domain-containing protein [Halogeometricum sp. S1BR25-6]|uniref:DUF1616 domain-containing protein n=1 Tax=Halogeometricum salsisoli TaxID=2950536 RepID=A0ABU2GJC7_9EURY|nr:DUF1616 domain-containing protein [Halogeometricum sp. S1BR25-6]MDS0300388.1 DUF1616 domain-containing protein [Halogeometricum sp. S1BR25-6]
MRNSAERTSGAVGLTVEAVLVVVALAVFGAAALTLPPGPTRIAVVLLGLLWLPGYAITTLVFPKRVVERPARSRRLGRTDTGSRRGTLTGAQRAGLSLGLSVAVLPVFGVVIVASPLALSVPVVLAAVVGFTVLVFALGLVRRVRKREESRYVLPLAAFRRTIGAGFQGSALDTGLNVLLVLVLVVASAGFLGAVALPQDQTSYTRVSLLTENEQGNLVANGYQTDLTVGESAEYVLEVANHENGPETYTVVVEQQEVGEGGNVVRSAEIDRYQRNIGENVTWRLRHELRPTFAGENLRYTYLVYRGEAPDDPSVDSAYRHLTLDINVSGS